MGLKPVALMFLFSLVGFVGCTTTVATPTPDIPATVTAAVEVALTPQPFGPTATRIPTPSSTLATMVNLVRPGVVRINTNLGSGSGVLFESDPINRSGLVLTNLHVIEAASWVDVLVNDSTTYSGTVLGVDSVRDLAVLRICCSNYHALRFGNAKNLEVGSEAVAIGYALGIPGSATVTRGIVSAIRYDSSTSRWVIQVDASINPGNSGGPLFSLDGGIIGINTFKIESAGGGRAAEGLGFAVSESTIQPLLAGLKIRTNAKPPTPTPTPREPPTIFGQYFKGRVLHLNVVTLDRAPELLYMHRAKHYQIRPSDENLELVLIRVKVENHTATSVIVNIDSRPAEIRDFLRGKYFAFNPNERAEEVDAPANPADERSLVFLWNPTLLDGTSEAFVLKKDEGIDGWMVFEAPKDTKFREFRWRAGDSLSIDF